MTENPVAPTADDEIEVDPDKAELYTDDLDEPEDFEFEDDDEDDEDDTDLVQVTGPIPLSDGRCEITLHLSLSDVNTLQEALDTAAVTLGRYGMDPFYVLALDPASGKQWVTNAGRTFQEESQDDESGG